MSELPSGWAETTLGEITSIVSGSTPKTGVPDYWGGDIAWITPDDLSRNRSKTITHGARMITHAGYESCSTTLMPVGSVLYSSRAPIGYVAIATGPVCTNQGFKSFVPNEAISSDFLYWFLTYATPEIRKLGSGTTFPELSKAKAKEIRICLPPLNEQRRIVAAIEEHFSRLDAADASLAAASRRLDGFLIRASTTAFRAEWPRRPFREVAEVASNLVDPHDYPDLPHIAPNHIERATGRLLPYRTIAEDGVTSQKHLFRPGQIIYSKIRPYLAKATLVDFEGLCSADMYPIDTGLDARFLLRWMLTPEFTELTVGQQGRSVLPKINREQLSRLPVPVPPLEEQRRIVAEIEERLGAIDALRAAIERAQRRGAALRRSVLERAFRGELVPQDPSDEPASVLLDRIRAERAAAIPTRRPSRPRARTSTELDVTG